MSGARPAPTGAPGGAVHTPQGSPGLGGRTIGLVALMLVQSLAAAFFLSDVISDIRDAGSITRLNLHLGVELAANLVLAAGILVEAQVLRRMLRRQAHTDRALSIASGALHDLMEGWFADWSLTPAEADVAAFTIKGCSIAEIAQMRGSAEGTVKTHLNAIYRKAGVTGRAQLVSLLVEELLQGPVVGKKSPE